MTKAIYKIRDRKIPKPLRDRIPEQYSGNSFIPPGWKGLTVLLDEELSTIVPDYKLHQVKEKFGTLRYYINHSNYDEETQQKAFDIISKYEKLTEHVCEICGQEGSKVFNTRRVATLCDEHKDKE